jgi:hypothetical protein
MNTSVYRLNGSQDATATLNTLTNTPSTGSTNLSSLSTSVEANTLIFRNQPLSWWLESLNSGAIKYTPVSNDVNWSYFSPSGQQFHIRIELSNLLIPNRSKSSSRNADKSSFTVTFEPKFSLERTDTMTMPGYRSNK